MSKQLRKYLRDLLILGVGAPISAGFFFYFFLQSTHPEDWTVFSLPVKILAITVAYFLVNHIGPGGNVNIYFMAHEPNEDEILLNRLIAKYRNKVIVIIPAIIYLVVDIAVGISRYNAQFNFDAVFGYLFFTFFIGAAVMQGVKYFSAWWNMQKVLRKDPTGELLVSSVKNDPEIAKVDKVKVLIDLPKLLKKIFK